MASCLLHGVHHARVLDQSGHCSRSACALDLPETKTWADCKACNQTPYCSPTFKMTRAVLRCTYLNMLVHVFLSQLSNDQVANINSCICDSCLHLRFLMWVRSQCRILRNKHLYWINTANIHIRYIMPNMAVGWCIF